MDAVMERSAPVVSRKPSRHPQRMGVKKGKDGAGVSAPLSFSLKEVAIIVCSLDYVQQQALGEVEQDEYHSVLTAMSKLARLSGLEGPRDFGRWVSPKSLGA